MRIEIVFTVTLLASALCPVIGHGGEKHTAPTAAAGHGVPASPLSAISVAPVDTASEISGAMGFEEKGGSVVPPGLVFTDERGNSVRFGDVVKGPTILSLVYFKCPNECSLLLTGIAQTLRAFADKPGTAPNVLTVSIGSDETTADALKARSIALAALQKPYPADRWRFLIGRGESVKKLADAVGFRYVKKGDDYDHPLGIIVLSPQGKVVRYITGTDFLPVEIRMSLMEASKGAVQPAIARVVRACFSYDPVSHRFVFKMLQVSGIVIFLILGSFVAYLVVSGKSRLRTIREGR